MKTSWSIDYLRRAHGSPRKVNEWRRQKRQDLEELTGVRWEGYHLRGRIVFRAIYEHQTTEAGGTAEDVARLVEALPKWEAHRRDFWSLAQEMEWGLVFLMRVVKRGNLEQALMLDVGRIGNATAVGRAYRRP